ncbi:zinc finger CCHC domain-containing protein 18-like [Ostrea edulis]|uniref:zinc finger CCHC domain-containing protein 18-like n=1 Tax=Ostrea edulis TaxID=37623 RepID=UPI0024AF9120|nr:zinc finger CCHC domain-containing protein 18-like [Ostrea edulis]
MAEVPEQYKRLLETLGQMEVVPKADNPDDLVQWMKEYVESKAETTVKTEKVETQPGNQKKYQHIVQPLRFSLFSGNDKSKGSDTTFDLWLYEVQCVMRDKVHSEEDIAQAVRRSLRGEAGRVIMNLGPDANLQKIISKLNSVYGDIDERENILGEFYGTKQARDEDVTTWSCRLENIMQRAIKVGAVKLEMADEMLYDMLYKGLKPELKASCHYEKEIHKGFDDLRVALRKLEKELKLDEEDNKKVQVKQAIAQKADSGEIEGVLKQITHRLENLEYQNRGRKRYRGSGNRNRDKNYYRKDKEDDKSQEQVNDQYPDIVCRRCGREGHIERGCRANRDVHGKPLTLNYNKSMKRGHP